MTSQHTNGAARQQAGGPGQVRHGRHRWMMIACCIPMIAIFVALWLAGVIPASFLLIAFACTAMMALMMGAMGHGDEHAGHEADQGTRR